MQISELNYADNPRESRILEKQYRAYKERRTGKEKIYKEKTPKLR